MSIQGVLQRITTALDQAGIPYMLSGSFASAYYGGPRTTQDIDLIIAPTPPQLRALVNSLPPDAYYVDLDAALEALKRRSLFNVLDLETGWKIDLIIRKSRTFSEEEFARRQLAQIHTLPIFVASAEDIVIAKLEWSKLAQSQRHIEDVAGILRMRWESLDRSYIEKWISQMGLEKEWDGARCLAGIAEIRRDGSC